MGFLAEMLAILVIWLSSLALGQFGVAVDKKPLPKPSHERSERAVQRSPRTPIRVPVAAAPPACDESAALTRRA
jgi:hypothetical protein